MPDFDIVTVRKDLIKMFTEINRLTSEGVEYDTVIFLMAKKWATVLSRISAGGINIDDALNGLSENPVQNKVITQNINNIVRVINTLNTLATTELPNDDVTYIIKNGQLVEFTGNNEEGTDPNAFMALQMILIN